LALTLRRDRPQPAVLAQTIHAATLCLTAALGHLPNACEGYSGSKVEICRRRLKKNRRQRFFSRHCTLHFARLCDIRLIEQKSHLLINGLPSKQFQKIPRGEDDVQGAF
jgi:hypothetical protein